MRVQHRLHHVRVLGEELAAHQDVRGDELAVRPQVLLVDQDLRALGHVLRDPRLGHPGALDLPGAEGRQPVSVGLRFDRDVAATLDGRGQAFLLEPVAQSDILRVAQLRCREGLALEIRGTVDVLTDHQGRPSGCRAGDHCDRLTLRLGVGADRRVRPDVGDVQGVTEQSRHGVGTRVERRRCHSEPERLHGVLEVALLQADQRRGVGQVGEEPQPYGLDLLAGRATGRGCFLRLVG